MTTKELSDIIEQARFDRELNVRLRKQAAVQLLVGHEKQALTAVGRKAFQKGLQGLGRAAEFTAPASSAAPGFATTSRNLAAGGLRGLQNVASGAKGGIQRHRLGVLDNRLKTMAEQGPTKQLAEMTASRDALARSLTQRDTFTRLTGNRAKKHLSDAGAVGQWAVNNPAKAKMLGAYGGLQAAGAVGGMATSPLFNRSAGNVRQEISDMGLGERMNYLFNPEGATNQMRSRVRGAALPGNRLTRGLGYMVPGLGGLSAGRSVYGRGAANMALDKMQDQNFLARLMFLLNPNLINKK